MLGDFVSLKIELWLDQWNAEIKNEIHSHDDAVAERKRLKNTLKEEK